MSDGPAIRPAQEDPLTTAEASASSLPSDAHRPGPTARYVPPRPVPLSPLAALIRTAAQGEGNLLSLLPAAAYRLPVTHLGYSRRSILLVNEPELLRGIMTDPTGLMLSVAAMMPSSKSGVGRLSGKLSPSVPSSSADGPMTVPKIQVSPSWSTIWLPRLGGDSSTIRPRLAGCRRST